MPVKIRFIPGDKANLMTASRKPHIVPPCDEAIELVHQDDCLLVINKPQPMLSTPGRLPENRDSAITRLRAQHPSAELVHRLDMATSGLMVIALSKPATRHLSRQFQQRQVEKSYCAMLQGHVAIDSGEINLPIITDWPRRPLQKICHETGKPALTRYQVLEHCDNHTTRVRFTPVTGRSHQLRIHSLAIGHPILGCQLYHQAGSATLAKRLLLHAEKLGFYHPITEQWMTFECPAPF